MNPAQLSELVRVAAYDVLVARGLDATALPVDAALERPRHSAHGGYATSVMLRAARSTGLPPRRLAGWLAEELAGREGVAAAAVAGPGFVNLRLSGAAHGAVVGQVLAAGAAYGHGDEYAGRTVAVDAAPTPTDLRGWRRRAVADAHARLLGARGATVSREGAAVVAKVTGPALPELLAVAGADAVRFWLLRFPATAPVAVDPALLVRRTDRNPAFLVLHAHARLADTARHAMALGVAARAPGALLDHPHEGDLIRSLGEFPQVVATAAALGEPHRVARYAEALAADVHRFAGTCRVLPRGDEATTDLHGARLALCDAARQVLGGALGLLDVTAVERL